MIRLFEKWKDIEGYEGIYQISNYGRVRSVNRFETNKIGVKRFLKGSLKNTFYSKNGYELVTLSKNNINISIPVHILVARGFINNDLMFKQVNHKDGKKSNNKSSNLEWCTPRENTHHIRNNMKSTSKYVGVSYDVRAKNKPWISRITINGKTRYLGRFATEKEAYIEYLNECQNNNIKIRKL